MSDEQYIACKHGYAGCRLYKFCLLHGVSVHPGFVRCGPRSVAGMQCWLLVHVQSTCQARCAVKVTRVQSCGYARLPVWTHSKWLPCCGIQVGAACQAPVGGVRRCGAGCLVDCAYLFYLSRLKHVCVVFTKGVVNSSGWYPTLLWDVRLHGCSCVEVSRCSGCGVSFAACWLSGMSASI